MWLPDPNGRGTMFAGVVGNAQIVAHRRVEALQPWTDRWQPQRAYGLRVLIVEDSWHMAMAVRSLLEGAGMGVAGAAATTIEAERLASVGTPRVAVVDVKLRDGMAFELIGRLREPGIAVDVVSGFSTFSTPLGKVAAVLQKPFVGGELLDALIRACC